MGSVVVVGPVRGENLVGLAAEQEVEFLLEDAVELFAERLIEIGHLPAAELEALGWILGRPAGRLHDAIHGNHGADDNLPHGSLSLSNETIPNHAGLGLRLFWSPSQKRLDYAADLRVAVSRMATRSPNTCDARVSEASHTKGRMNTPQ